MVMLSACLGGIGCGVDGSTNGDHTPLRAWLVRPEVRLVKFCPEQFSFGTPRMTPRVSTISDGRLPMASPSRTFVSWHHSIRTGSLR